MRKTTIFTFCIFSLLISTMVFAEGDITTIDFTIPLGDIDPVNHSGGGTTGINSLFYILEGFSRMLLYMIPIFAIVSFLIAGYYYIFSAGDAEKAGRAKTIIKWNIVAIVVALMSWSIIQLIASLFSN